MEYPKLTVSKNGQMMRDFEIAEESVLGRGEACGIRLEDRAVSREHAVIRPVGEGLQIQSKSEFAPLLINGAEVTSAILKQGDVVKVGPYSINVSLPEKRLSNSTLNSMSIDSPGPVASVAKDLQETQKLDTLSMGELKPLEQGLEPLDDQDSDLDALPELSLGGEGEEAFLPGAGVTQAKALQAAESDTQAFEVSHDSDDDSGDTPAGEGGAIGLVPGSFGMAELQPLESTLTAQEETIPLGGVNTQGDIQGIEKSMGIGQNGIDLTNMFQEGSGQLPLQATEVPETPELTVGESAQQVSDIFNQAMDIPLAQEVSLTGSDGQAKSSFTTKLEATGPSEAELPLGDPELKMDTATAPQPGGLKLNLDDTSGDGGFKTGLSGMSSNSAPAPSASAPASASALDTGFNTIGNSTAVNMPTPEDVTQANTGAIEATLYIPLGKANHTEFPINKPEVLLGRAKKCEIILKDPKSSGKHAKILRVGNTFVLEDLGSSNGTFHNGQQVQGQVALAGEDKVRIGDTEMVFKAVSAEFEAEQSNFLNLPTQELGSIPAMSSPGISPSPLTPGGTGSFAGVEPVHMTRAPGAGTQPLGFPAGQGPIFGQAPPALPGNIPGLDGIAGTPAKKKRSLRPLILGIFVLYAALEMGYLDGPKPKPAEQAKKQDPAQSQVKPANTQDAVKPKNTYANLSDEERKKVDQQMDTAAALNRQKKYEEARFELQRVLALLPEYPPAVEMLTYVEEDIESKRKEEQRRRDEERIKTLQAQAKLFVEQAEQAMAAKNYQDAEKLFDKILELEPENERVPAWREVIRRYYEQLAEEEERKRLAAIMNEDARKIYREGLAMKEKGRCISAISRLRDVAKVNAPDKSINQSARARIAECEEDLKNRYDPVIAEASSMEEGGLMEQAYSKFEEASKIDPRRREAPQGMSRIRGILEEKAKVTYTEAVINESFSDFEKAIKKFNETMKIAPKDSIYYQRAKRKIARYERFGAGGVEQESVQGAPEVELE